MYKNKGMWLVIGLIRGALGLSACAKPTPAPTEVVPTEAPTKAAPTATVAEVPGCPPSTVADPMGVPAGEWPQQYELAEFEGLADCELTFSENLNIAELNAALNGPDSVLPPVEERLPEEPLVVQPYDEIGTYGGRLLGVSFAPESGTSDILSWRHVNLVRYSDDLTTLVPNVPKSWEWNDDFTEITFHLRKGHKWSDGEPFTVDDILFWYEDIELNKELKPDVPSQFVYGGEPMEIEKIDDVTFKISFAAPAPGFLIQWNSYIQPWQPKHFLSQFHIDYNPDANELATADGYADWVELFRSYYHDWKDSYHQVGVPTLESHVLVEETSEYRLLVANPYYFKVDTAGQQLPYVDQHYETFIADKEVINLKIIAGEIDLKMQGIDLTSYPLFKENEAAGNYTVQLPPAGMGWGVFYCLNITHPDLVKREIFADIRFKQAMSLALNRDEINETIFLGLARPMQGLPTDPRSCPFVEPWMETYMTEYDPDQANELLDEMGLTERDADGFRLRPDGKTLTVYMDYCQQAAPVLLNEMVKEYWEAVGVKVQLKEVSSEVYRAHTLTNEQDISLWHNDGTSCPALISDPNATRLYPPFSLGLSQFTGGPWYDWWLTDGAEGEEPPEDMEHLRELSLQFAAAQPYSDEWMEFGKEITKMHAEYLFTIGTVGDVPWPVIVHNRLGNTPQWSINLWDFYWTYAFRIDQCYVKE